MQFYVVYIREAHAVDSPAPMGGDGAPLVEDPRSLHERQEVAQVCMTRLALEPMPALVDELDDAVNQAYQAWPDRLYLIGTDGRLVYAGEPGPFGFKPKQLEDAIAAYLSER